VKNLILGLLFLLFIQISYAQTVTTFILVRHAEKAAESSSDPDLRAEGTKRAELLAALLSKASVDAVYSTNFKRTRNTVTPLATAKSLTVNTYNSMKAADLEALLTKHKGGTIVIAGHSNTIPEIANVLIGENKFDQFADDDYGNILVISVQQIGRESKVVWLRY
jgi:broad specificity phosphatase PhoE